MAQMTLKASGALQDGKMKTEGPIWFGSLGGVMGDGSFFIYLSSTSRGHTRAPENVKPSF